MSNLTSPKTKQRESIRPFADILVEGELSPFEHEALYQLLRKHFLVKQPVYDELDDETVGTKISLTFHHSYNREFFTEIFQRGWRELKDLFKQISYRRGRLGASFNLCFSQPKHSLVFSTGVLGDQELGSAMDQLAHLTGVIGQMLRPEMIIEPLEKIDVAFDKKGDRWSEIHASNATGNKAYVFDETLFRWKRL